MKFYRSHRLLIDLLLVALILRLVYLNAVAMPVFDEAFYVPAARQLLANWTDINPEHPPLAKEIIAGSIALFGDNQLAWRLPAVIAGLACIAALYFVALELSGNKRTALLAAALLAFDPLSILLSRTAMLDIFMLAFSLGGTYFLLKKNVVAAGLLFGLGIASKWPAVLPLLAVSVFMAARKKIGLAELGRMLLLVGLAFVLASSPFIISEGPAQWFSSRTYYIGDTITMPTENSMASTAMQWLYLQKPVWFARDLPDFKVPSDMHWLTDILGGKPAFGLVALGNPVFWLPGLFALVWLGLDKTKKLSNIRLFSLLWFAFTYVPFLLLPRSHMFLYYMLPVLPAYALALSQFLVKRRWEKWYLVVLAASLVLFLPLVIGLPAPDWYYETLRPLIGSYPAG